MMKIRLSPDAVDRIVGATGLKIKPDEYFGNAPPIPAPDIEEILHQAILNYYGAVQRRSDKRKFRPYPSTQGAIESGWPN